MSLIPGVIVPAPEPVRRRYGLFDAGIGPIDLPAPHGEGGGVRFVPVTCGEAYALGVNCYDPGEAPVKPLDTDTDEVSSGVFVALATLECSAPGYTREEFRTKALRRLEGSEQATVERALWSGLDFEGNTLDILNLDDGAEAVPAGYDPDMIASVIGALERFAYTDNGYGSVAYLHAPVEAAAFAAEAGLVLPDGPRKVTPMGSVWVFGAYPLGEVIVTGQTAVWRAPEIQVYDAFEPVSNARLLVAERAYSVAFECFAGRATFDPLGS